MKNLFSLCLTAISLVGFAHFGFAERYETIIVKTDDTAQMGHADAVTYLKSNAVISTQTLEIQDGEVAYVFASGAVPRPGATSALSAAGRGAFLSTIIVDVDGLDSNQTIGGWNPVASGWGEPESISNIASTVQPVAGPATIRIRIKPSSFRLGNYSGNSNYWAHSSNNNWDFKASEGYVTFRIVGSEQEASKKFATVIPENSSGNVNIILEQSTDLINWSAVNPGSFAPSASKRFFRVRAQE